MLSWALIAATLAASAVADPYTISLGAHSPALTYFPVWENATRADGNTWRGTYTDVTANTHINSQSPSTISGDQIMWNSGRDGDDAPRVKYSFTGTGIAFRGYFSKGSSVDLVVDGQSTTFYGTTDGTGSTQLVTLANTTDLDNGNHDAELVLRKGDVSLLFVDVTLDFPDIPLKTIEAAKAAVMAQDTWSESMGNNDTSPSIVFAQKKNGGGFGNYVPNTQIATTGTWKSVPNLSGGSPYGVISSNVSGSTATVELGSGNFFVRVNGSLLPTNDKFGLTITPAPPNRNATYTGYAFSWPWLGRGALYMAALDPTVSYKMTLENMQTMPGGAVNIHSVEMWKGEKDPANAKNPPNATANANTNGNGKAASGKETKQSTPTGAIVGGVVGAILGLAIIGAIVFFLVRKNRKVQRGPQETRFEIEDQTYEKPSVQSMQPTPFPAAQGFDDPRSRRNGRRAGTASSSAKTREVMANASASSSTESFDLEEDAGALLSPPERTRRAMPPSYDPSWAPSESTEMSSDYAESSPVGGSTRRLSTAKR